MEKKKRKPRIGRRVLAMLVTVCMLVAMVPGGFVSAATEDSSDELEWRYSVDDDGYATITRYLGSDTNIVVPGAINGYEVTTIGTLAFNRNDEIDSISIPSTVTTIESWAFYDLNGLEVLTIGGDLESVASDAFMSSNASAVEVYTTEATATLLKESVSAMANNDSIYTAEDMMITITVTLALESEEEEEDSDASEEDSLMGDMSSMGDPPDGGGGMGGSTSSVTYTADYGEASAPYGTYFAPVSSEKNYQFNYSVLTADGVTILSITGATLGSETESSYSGTIVDFSEDVTIEIILTGTASYEEVNEEATYAEGFSPDETGVSYDKTFRNLTAEEATALNEEISSSSGYSAIAVRIVYEEGYYINGDEFPLDDDLVAYDVETGVVLYDGAGLTGSDEVMYTDLADLPDATSDSSTYQYVGYEMNEEGTAVAVLYYSPWSLDSDSTSTVVSGIISLLTGGDAPVNGMEGQADMDEVYASFINSVITADGEDEDIEDLASYASSFGIGTVDEDGVLTIYSDEVGDDGNVVLAEVNEERSIVYATDGATITTGAVNLVSTATINNAKMSYEAGLSSYNEEIGMEWGITAVAYATSGGHIILGDPTGETISYITAVGETTNGAIAVTTGDDGGTSIVEVYNTVMDLQGWNNHIADVMYGGYIYLENVTGTNGVEGSYALGQSGSITNDFGNGVIEGTNVTVVAYGNRTAGTYVIGGGIINLEDSDLKCYVDGGAVIASGGTFHISDSTVEGVSGLKIRGSIETENVSTFTNVTLIANQDYADVGYVYGEYADAAVEAWVEYSGSTSLAYWMMSTYGYTMGEVCDYYGIEGDDRTAFYAALDEILDDDETYTDDTLLRCSVLDNTRYNYSGGVYADTDNSDVPYLTIGAFGGLTQSVILAEAAGAPVELYNCTFINMNDSDYNYLISSESGSHPDITFIDTEETITGIIWNEGTNTNRTADGHSATGDSYIDVTFENSDFEGSFADGDNGLWEGSISYTDYDGNETTLNGNYYGATANWGITASFDSESSWTVANDSYIGSLTIEEGAVLDVISGKQVASVTIDGEESSLEVLAAGGTFENVVILLEDAEEEESDGICAQDETCPISAYTDADATAWYHDGVHYAIENGYMIGTSDTTFEPDTATTRTMIVTILYRLAGSPEVTGTSSFTDAVSGSWYEDALIWAEQQGIAKGYGNGEFGVDDEVTREQIATFFYRYDQLIAEEQTEVETADLTAYPDYAEISDWAEEAVVWAVSSGLIDGEVVDGETILAPTDNCSRAMTATILQRYAE